MKRNKDRHTALRSYLTFKEIMVKMNSLNHSNGVLKLSFPEIG